MNLADKIKGSEYIEMLKEAAFIDELKKIAFGSGKTAELNKTADVKPDKWHAQSGLLRAMAEDPQRYKTNELKGQIAANVIPFFPAALYSNLAKSHVVKNTIFPERTLEEKLMYQNKETPAEAIIKSDILKKINKKAVVGVITGAVLGNIIASNLSNRKYLKERGIKKNLLGRYSFNEQAARKYL